MGEMTSRGVAWNKKKSRREAKGFESTLCEALKKGLRAQMKKPTEKKRDREIRPREILRPANIGDYEEITADI